MTVIIATSRPTDNICSDTHVNNSMHRFLTNSNLLCAAVTVVGAVALLIISCVHELPVPTAPGKTGGPGTSTGGQIVSCSKDTVYFTNTILPLINSVCGKSGCHGSSNRNSFALTSYSNIAGRLGTVRGLNDALQGMADQLNENPNLAYTPPSSDQLNLLQTWISQGAKNNSCNSCDTTQFTYAAVISPIISTYCKGCHTGSSGGGGVDLSGIASIQSEITTNPGRLLGSVLWIAPYTGTKQMPQGGSQLPVCNITQIKKWIAAGAPNN